MLLKMRNVCILAVVIAVIAVFVDANDLLTKFPTITQVNLAQLQATTTNDATTTTTITSVSREISQRQVVNAETTTKNAETTLPTSVATRIEENTDLKNDSQNYQNLSRVEDEEEEKAKATKNKMKQKMQEMASSRRQMNMAEMLTNEQQRRHANVNDNVDQRKLQQTNEDGLTMKTTKKTINQNDNLVGVNQAKLAEFAIDGQHEHELLIPDLIPAVTKTRKILDLYPLQDPFKLDVNQNHMPNEVETMQQQQKLHTIFNNRQSGVNLRHGLNDFTGKLLAEEDGGEITEIEQKFRIDELAATNNTKPTPLPLESLDAAIAKVFAAAAAKGGNTLAASSQVFLDRRVKKSYNINEQQQITTATTTPIIILQQQKQQQRDENNNNNNNNDFAQTKFSNGSHGKMLTGVMQPEFSTTKFYNNKELYNEMMNNNNNNKNNNNNNKNITNENNNNKSSEKSLVQNGSSNQYAVLTNAKFKTFRKSKDMNLPSYAPPTASASASAVTSSTHVLSLVLPKITTATTITPSTSTIISETKTTHDTDGIELLSAAEAVPTQTESNKVAALERIKWRLKAILPVSNNNKNTSSNRKNSYLSHNITSGSMKTTTDEEPKTTETATNSDLSDGTSVTRTSTATANANSNSNSYKANQPAKTSDNANASTTKITTITTIRPTTTTIRERERKIENSLAWPKATVSSLYIKIPTNATITTTTLATVLKQHRATNPTKSSLKPISRPRTLTQLQMKINALECEIINVVANAHLWRGNETHELLLPIMSANNCQEDNTEECFGTRITSWDGEAEIQSGDILIVEINDALLNAAHDHSNTSSAHNTQVYQVTRSGHEHCDVTEGILLDITPLVVDGRKLVTLYDKDLTEGVNLLIVVSELWGNQCVRLKVTTKTDNCGENADCSGKGVCYSSAAMEEYECQCCSGFAGPHCEEIDACTPSPCTNNGICVDLSQGHDGNSYQCLCPYGYTGKNCQYEADPCNPIDCLNGGSCVGNSTHFRCDCTAGFTGPLCQHSLNECESSPCLHGICVDQEDGFRCFCQPGFAGELCNFEYNECESNPCQNGGECIDHIGSYECHCMKGFSGNRCQTKVDLCANKVCPEGHRCIDRGNELSCECPGGRNGPDCNKMSRTQCNVNPCTHGGTCWSSGDTYYCACRPGYTGTMCEDEFVVETVVSSSEFMVDDLNARNFNDKTYGSSVVLKSPIELHNAYFAAGVLAATIFIVAVVVTICHCKVNQTYRKFSTRTTAFFPILGFGRRPKSHGKLHKHWLSGKGLAASAHLLRSNGNYIAPRTHLPVPPPLPSQPPSLQQYQYQQHQQQQLQHNINSQLGQRNADNDMYYTVDFSDNSQHSPLIQ